MAKKTIIQIAALQAVCSQRDGATAREISAELKIPQPQLSRLIAAAGGAILKFGNARNTRYFLRRTISQLPAEIPVYEVNEAGSRLRAGTLVPVAPAGFIWTPEIGPPQYFPDIPYFLNDLRPAGFLGRLIPRLYPQWLFPADIRIWGGDDALRYLYHLAEDVIGNLVIGDRPITQECSGANHSAASTIQYYEEQAVKALNYGHPGSSAAGEQPKFLGQRPSDAAPILVKFAAIDGSKASKRTRDLVFAEHSALCCYYQGNPPYGARILESPTRIFLELERFDRTVKGRRGIISFMSLDAEFTGVLSSWSSVAQALRQLNIISSDDETEAMVRDAFGILIGNEDRHLGNCSCYQAGSKILGLAPVYDMLPTTYLPHAGEIRTTPLQFSPAQVRDTPVWRVAQSRAVQFWNLVATSSEITTEFRSIAETNADNVRSIFGGLI